MVDLQQHWAQSEMDGWPLGPAIKKWTSIRKKFFFTFIFFVLFCPFRLFHSTFNHMSSLENLNVSYFALYWKLIFSEKINYQFRAKYNTFNFFNELIWWEIDWKSPKWRKNCKKFQMKFHDFQRSPIQVLAGLDAA